ncbi:MAG: hypothetical protein WCV68_00425 [Candidatus Paceibacterota bacterium]|jgi:hypothetical protein
MPDGSSRDWAEVVKRNPKGDFEFQGNGNTVLRGPVKSITLSDEGLVSIDLWWAAEMPVMGEEGFGIWHASNKRHFGFPNFALPYVIEDTPEKGERIRFGISLIYLERLEGENTLDVRKVNGLTCVTHVVAAPDGPCPAGGVALSVVYRDVSGQSWADPTQTISPEEIAAAVQRCEFLALKTPLYLTETQHILFLPNGKFVLADLRDGKPIEEIEEEVEFAEAPAPAPAEEPPAPEPPQE